MYCPNCGFPNQDSSKFCEKCGNHLNAPAAGEAIVPAVTQAPAVQTPMAHTPAVHTPIQLPKNPLTVAQMMLGVCILLAVVIPATGFYQWFVRGVSDAYGIVDAGDLSQLLDNGNGGSDLGKSYLQLFTLRIALESPLLILSLYAGISLWKKRPGSLELAKWFLLALVVFMVFSHLVFPHLFGLSVHYDATLAVEFWLCVAVLGACYYFLQTSKQVKEYCEAPLLSSEGVKSA